MTTPVYDLFISYNSRDHELVSRLRDELTQLGCESVFLDRLHLQPGQNWVDDLEAALLSSRSMAVFLGAGDMGRWQLRERAWALDQTTLQNSYKVIPVLLPGAKPPLGFLQQQMWIDLRLGTNPRLPLPDRERTQQLKRLAEAIRGQAEPVIRDSSCYESPYRGLQAFREEDAGLFFGRDAAIKDLQELVRQQRLIAVTGASGCGKSSVVRAGLLPKLRKVTRGQEVWDIVTMFPRTDPLKSLAEAFQPLVKPRTEDAEQCRIQINERRADLAEKRLFLEDLVKVAMDEQSGTTRLLLVIDQWEELYTQCTDATLRAHFIEELLKTVRAPHIPITVIFTIRWDFYGRVLSNRPLLDAIGKSRLDLGPMNREELEQVIHEPAKATGLAFEAGLVTRILNDAEREPGSLPLLEFLLHQLWENRPSDNHLTHQIYQDAGQLQGAIRKYADDYYENKLDKGEKLNPSERAVCGTLFRQLVRAGLDSSQDTRCRANLTTLSETEQSAAQKLVDARLLISGADSHAKDSTTASDSDSAEIVRTVEVAHEELLRRWDKLRGWIDEDREFLHWRTSLETQLRELARDPTALLRGRRLEDARRYFPVRASELSPKEKELVQGSLDARKAELEREAEEQRRKAKAEQDLQAARQKNRNILKWGSAAAAFLLLAIWSVFTVLNNRQQAERLVREYLQRPTGYLIEQMQKYRGTAVSELEKSRQSDKGPASERLRATVALMSFEPSPELPAVILDHITAATRDDWRIVTEALLKLDESGRQQLLEDLQKRTNAATADRALQLRYLLLTGLLGHWEPLNRICRADEDPTDRTDWIHDQKNFVLIDLVLLAEKAFGDQTTAEPDTQSAVCLVLGVLGTEALEGRGRLRQLYENSPEPGIHAAARWALQQQGIGAAELDRWIEGKKHPGWEVTATKSQDGKPLTPFTMIRIPRLADGSWLGSVTDYSNPGDKNAAEPTEVDLKPIEEFWISDREVTVRQFRELMPEHPRWSDNSGNNLAVQATPAIDERKPMLDVSWYDAVLFCNRLSDSHGLTPYYALDKDDLNWATGELHEGRPVPEPRPDGVNGYRLPSEREWEWACRAGSQTDFSWGSDSSRVDLYSVFNRGFGRESAVDVAALIPAANGLFDMHGNGDEWSEDWSDGDRVSRVLRGGSFGSSNPDDLRCAYRDFSSPDFRNYSSGFRLSRTK